MCVSPNLRLGRNARSHSLLHCSGFLRVSKGRLLGRITGICCGDCSGSICGRITSTRGIHVVVAMLVASLGIGIYSVGRSGCIGIYDRGVVSNIGLVVVSIHRCLSGGIYIIVHWRVGSCRRRIVDEVGAGSISRSGDLDCIIWIGSGSSSPGGSRSRRTAGYCFTAVTTGYSHSS